MQLQSESGSSGSLEPAPRGPTLPPPMLRTGRWLGPRGCSDARAAARETVDSSANSEPFDKCSGPCISAECRRPGIRFKSSSGASTQIAGATPQLGIGDKIKLAFYERLDDVEKDKWGKSSSNFSQDFQARPELTGEYTVQEDGRIALPMLGSFSAEHETI